MIRNPDGVKWKNSRLSFDKVGDFGKLAWRMQQRYKALATFKVEREGKKFIAKDLPEDKMPWKQ